MTDEQLLEAFESTELPAEQFTHVTHVRVAWCYLQQAPVSEALFRFAVALRRFATAKGATGKYHETITVAYMLLIAARLNDDGNSSWDEFAAANADLLSRNPSVLSLYYSAELLASERARRGFVMPDVRC